MSKLVVGQMYAAHVDGTWYRSVVKAFQKASNSVSAKSFLYFFNDCKLLSVRLVFLWSCNHLFCIGVAILC